VAEQWVLHLSQNKDAYCKRVVLFTITLPAIMKLLVFIQVARSRYLVDQFSQIYLHTYATSIAPSAKLCRCMKIRCKINYPFHYPRLSPAHGST
jgi:hypothetical protein